MANYPAHSQKQSHPHCLDPQSKTSHGTEGTQCPSPTQPTHPRNKKKRATFTFTSPYNRKVTNLFKQAGVKIVSEAKTHSHISTYIPFIKTANSFPNNPQAAQTLSLT